MITQIILFCILAYVIGSIPFALIVGKVFYNTDIRTLGSGNLGTTNTFRCLGKKAGVTVFIFLYPMLSLLLLAIFFSTLFLTGYVSLGSILISLTAIGYLGFFEAGIDKWVMMVMCVFVIYMHKKNIKRLLNGTENQSKLKIKRGTKNDKNH